MPDQPAFPIVQIHSERDLLLAPYRHAVARLQHALVDPGDESALKAAALRGAEQARVTAWDAAFATLGLRWASTGATSVTDPFLAAFDASGFVPATLELSTGGQAPLEQGQARIAAPLFALAEWELFKLRGNRQRLEHAFGLLKADFDYREHQVRRRNGLLSGSPGAYNLHATGRFMLGGRVVPSLAGGANWIDASCMYALNARVLAEVARALNRKEDAGELEWVFRDVAAKINARMWHEDDGWYYDLDEHGEPLAMKTLASVWAVWSGVAPRSSIERMAKRLSDPTQFERAHPWCTVAAGEGDYRRRDGMPVGVARADFNLLVGESLAAGHLHAAAFKGTEQHLARVAKVLKDSGEVYLAYDPDRDSPAPLGDGSSGSDSPLALALCIQNTLGGLFGLRPHGQRGELEITPMLEDRHVIENIPFAYGLVNLEVGAADKSGARRRIDVMCDVPFRLRVRDGDRSSVQEVQPGMHTLHG
ncbi:MAG: hypothetical protein KF696_04870 [Planctomycetes bacterium]|nr:hypothetical protein [Planctomycetota bacterium]MCW8134306.1 hypothetical protein [Planctomycetota bacterium]